MDGVMKLCSKTSKSPDQTASHGHKETNYPTGGCTRCLLVLVIIVGAIVIVVFDGGGGSAACALFPAFLWNKKKTIPKLKIRFIIIVIGEAGSTGME